MNATSTQSAQPSPAPGDSRLSATRDSRLVPFAQTRNGQVTASTKRRASVFTRKSQPPFVGAVEQQHTRHGPRT